MNDESLWLCPECGYETTWTWKMVQDRGTPVCPCCDCDLDLVEDDDDE